MREALAFLTPLGVPVTPTPRALPWFPVVGAGIGLAVGGVWWGAAEVWTPAVAAALAVSADLALTGMLHLDGLADSADGLLPHLPPERRLEVMRAPDVGAFGLGAGGAALLLRFSALAALAPDAVLVAGLWCLSRTAMAVAASVVPYARPSGLASAFVGGRSGAVGFGGLALGTTLAGVAAGIPGVVAAASVVLGATGVVLLARRRVGGFTGDVLGAAGVVGETVGLLAVAAW